MQAPNKIGKNQFGNSRPQRIIMRRDGAVGLSVARALGEAQRGTAAAHRKWAKLLGRRLREGGAAAAAAVLAELLACLPALLVVGKVGHTPKQGQAAGLPEHSY